MSTFDNFRHNPEPAQESQSRKSQAQYKNASSFDILSFNPSQKSGNTKDDSSQKKAQQASYKEELDRMVKQKKVKNAEERHVVEASNRQPGLQIGSEYNKPEYQSQQQKTGKQLKSQQYGDKFNPVTNAPETYGRSQPQEPQRRANEQSDYRTYEKPQDFNTFQQQDEQRDQLLNKIKSGYRPQNTEVANTYQRVHDANEKARQAFERNVVDKAAKEKFDREEHQAQSEHAKKKQMERDIHLANQRALAEKNAEKKKQKAMDDYADQQRIQESLNQYENENYRQKETSKKLREENTQALEKQRTEFNARKQATKNESAQSYGQENYDAFGGQEYGAKPSGKRQANSDNMASAMGNLSLKTPYGRDDQAGGPTRQYNEPPKSDYEAIRQKQRYGNSYNIITNDM